MPDFTGEFGGIIAGATIAGFGIGWKASMEVIVKPLKEAMQKQEDRVALLEGKFLDL